MGYDHLPYSYNSCGAPEAMIDAVLAGFGIHIAEFDLRTMEWR